ncbi:hypothetical protein ACGFIE_28185 [Micromonospora sp. NPDC049275]|uniref:hypothetical protein n=1 Tax=Micromonospora sp. NPDC049275 TaxID=3364268 RepID=UPI00371E1D10
MRAMPVVGTITCLLFVGACSSPAHRSGDAAPAGSPEQTTSAPTTGTSASPTSASPTSSSPSARPSGSATSTALVLGPNGLGSLKLGMSREQATATGMLRPFAAYRDECALAQLRSAPADRGNVNVSRTLGIATIDAYGSITTPEGARIGMSSAGMLRIYPGWKVADGDAANGRGSVKTPGNDKAVYRIATRNGTVTELTLQYANQNCYE